MATVAITPDYMGDYQDGVENFHGNQVVYFGWDHHVLFCSPHAFPLPPDMPFGAVLSDVLPGVWSVHPDFSKINWETATWMLNGEPFTPDPAKSLIDNGIDHKSALRLQTPELTGIAGTGS